MNIIIAKDLPENSGKFGFKRERNEIEERIFLQIYY